MDTLLTSIMEEIRPLTAKQKIELLNLISAALKAEIEESAEEDLLNELKGAWKDTPFDLAEELLKARTISVSRPEL